MKVLFTVDQDILLFPHFFSHYASLGVDQFICCVWNNIAEVKRTLKNTGKYNVVIVDDFADEAYFDSHHERVINLMQKEFVRPGEWFLVADLDELQTYPEALADMICQAEGTGCDCILGDFIDHVAVDGGFPPVRADQPLDQQYPIQTLFTQKVVQGACQKVMACKSFKKISMGNHSILGDHQPYPRRGGVHHYKWKEGVVQRLMRRRDYLKHLGVSWWAESERVLQYLTANGGRINTSDTSLLV